MSNPALPSNSSGIVMNILHFDKTVSINQCGLLYNEVYNPHFDEYDAITNVNVDLKTFSNMFCFETDYIDVNDASGSDVKYYVISQQIQSFIPNLGSSIVDTNPIVSVTSNGTTEIDQLVGKDFTRYLASLLFNTPYGTDLFINESALVNSVSSALSTAWSYCMTDLQNVSNTSTNQTIPLMGNTDAKYLTNDSSGVQNICRELFLQLISKSPSRFTNLPQIQLEDANVGSIREASNLNYYYLPFVNNDIVQLRVKVYPCEEQPTFGLSTTDTTKFETVNNNTHLKGRTYLINMILTDNSTPPPPPPPPVGSLRFSYVYTGSGTINEATVIANLPILTLPGVFEITTNVIITNGVNVDVTINAVVFNESSSYPSDFGFTFNILPGQPNNITLFYTTNTSNLNFISCDHFPFSKNGYQFALLSKPVPSVFFTINDTNFIPYFIPGTSLSNCFYQCGSFNSNISNWDTSNVTNMSHMFFHAYMFNQPLNTLITNNVTNTSHMFANAFSFNQPLHYWITDNVTNTSNMFSNALAFNQPLDLWNTINVTDMSSMFNGASTFNQPLINWNTSNVTNMNFMFAGASSFNQDINYWDTINVTDMKFMFYRASTFNQPLNYWKTRNVTNMKFMFNMASSFNQPLNLWDTSNVTDMSGMFEGASSFNQDITMWDTSNVIYA